MTPSRVSGVWVSNAGHWQIRSSIASVSTILGKLLFPDSVSSSSSLSSKTISSLTGSGFFTLLMHPIRASCLHPNVSVTKEGSAVDTFSSKSTYSSAEKVISVFFIPVRFRESRFKGKSNFVPEKGVRFTECPLYTNALYRDSFMRV